MPARRGPSPGFESPERGSPADRGCLVLSPALLTAWTRGALAAARAGDQGTAAELVARVAARGDVLDQVAACRVMADTALRSLRIVLDRPATDSSDRERWVLADVGRAPDRPPGLFAVRVVCAYANRDGDMVTALVAAAARAPRAELAESLWCLAIYAAELDARAARTNGTDPDES